MGFTHIDCFSGPGGICTGMHAAGFETKVAIEFIQSCCDTYSANHPEVEVIHSDIRKVTAEQILPFIPKDGVDLVTSGMPCETFSTAGNTSRSFYDDRQFLFREGIRIAEISNAKMILFENVPAITTKTVAKDSKVLMDGLFWSVAVTLDGAFLNMPEFIHMVNGGGSYASNGWHGMYAMSGIEGDNGRIYKVDDSLSLFITHAIAAARQFISDRRLLNGNWHA